MFYWKGGEFHKVMCISCENMKLLIVHISLSFPLVMGKHTISTQGHNDQSLIVSYRTSWLWKYLFKHYSLL